jgi:hypothetical protein
MSILKILLTCALMICSLKESSEAQPTKPIQRGEYAYLDIMHEQQSPDLCLPTCVSMAMNFYGEGKSQWTVKRLSNEHKALFSGTSFEEIQHGIKPLGYTWDRWQWHGDSIGFRHAVSAVEQSLDNGKPVIFEVRVQFFAGTPDYVNTPSFGSSRSQQAGHALLAFGYDNKAKQIFVMDPAMPFPGKRYISFDELQSMWRYFDGFYHGLFTAKAGDLPAGHIK